MKQGATELTRFRAQFRNPISTGICFDLIQQPRRVTPPCRPPTAVEQRQAIQWVTQGKRLIRSTDPTDTFEQSAVQDPWEPSQGRPSLNLIR